MSKVPITFEYSASHYCKFCNTWGTPGTSPVYEQTQPCGNCGEVGYLMQNPFPGNMVPYIELDRLTKGTDLQPSDKDMK